MFATLIIGMIGYGVKVALLRCGAGRQLLPNYSPMDRRKISKYGGTDKIPLTSTRQLESNFKFYTKKEGKRKRGLGSPVC